MPGNDHAVQFLEHFISSKVDPGYAVLIAGRWGTGKTHFIKEFLKGKCGIESGPKGGVKFLYVSLYGVTSAAEIARQIFIQLHPVLGGKGGNIVSGVTMRLINAGSNLFGAGDLVSQNDLVALRSSLLDMSGKVIVFDDLERSSLSVAESLGVINSYVVKEGVRVIVVANEDEVSDSKLYATQKEKVIGKTLDVHSDVSDVLNSIVRELKSESALRLIENNAAELIEIFGASGLGNFRSLRHVLLDFDRICSVACKEFIQSREGMRRALMFMVAIGQEFRAGRILAEDIVALTKGGISRTLRGMNGKQNEQDIRIKDLEMRYPSDVLEDSIVPGEVIASLFGSGILDVAAINAAVLENKHVVGSARVEPWRILWGMWQAPYTQFSTALRDVREQLKSEKVIRSGEILHLTGIAVQLKTMGAELVTGCEDIALFFCGYIDSLSSKELLRPSKGLFHSLARERGYGGYGFLEKESVEFHAVAKHLMIACAQIKLKEARLSAKDVLMNLHSQGELLYGIDYEEGGWCDVPLLNQVPTNEAVEIFVRDYVLDSRVSHVLLERHRMDRNCKLKGEWGWAFDFCREIESVADTSPPPMGYILRKQANDLSAKLKEIFDTNEALHALQPMPEPE